MPCVTDILTYCNCHSLPASVAIQMRPFESSSKAYQAFFLNFQIALFLSHLLTAHNQAIKMLQFQRTQ